MTTCMTLSLQICTCFSQAFSLQISPSLFCLLHYFLFGSSPQIFSCTPFILVLRLEPINSPFRRFSCKALNCSSRYHFVKCKFFIFTSVFSCYLFSLYCNGFSYITLSESFVKITFHQKSFFFFTMLSKCESMLQAIFVLISN
jgi:hypothetical protein